VNVVIKPQNRLLSNFNTDGCPTGNKSHQYSANNLIKSPHATHSERWTHYKNHVTILVALHSTNHCYTTCFSLIVLYYKMILLKNATNCYNI